MRTHQANKTTPFLSCMFIAVSAFAIADASSDENVTVEQELLHRFQDIAEADHIEDGPRRDALADGIAIDFLTGLERFIKPEYIPSIEDVKEGLIFSNDVPELEMNKWKGDVATLRYEIAGWDLTVSQTFSGSEAFFLAVNGAPDGLLRDVGSTGDKHPYESLLHALLSEDSKAPMDFELFKMDENAYRLKANKDPNTMGNYRQSMFGVAEPNNLSVIFGRRRYYSDGTGDPYPRWTPPSDKMFEFVLGEYSSRDEMGLPRQKYVYQDQSARARKLKEMAESAKSADSDEMHGSVPHLQNPNAETKAFHENKVEVNPEPTETARPASEKPMILNTKWVLVLALAIVAIALLVILWIRRFEPTKAN